MSAAIRCEGLSKRYVIGERESYRTLRDSVMKTLRVPLRRSRHERPSIWALRDISFEVQQGEVLGIIGRNGAGKSTLLKLLSRITEPTEGSAELHGRVGSLLEVGTGFHPELTGRENVFLNGAILGMKKAEITRNFDQIVAFAELERFIDTPVKRYSSGMYMRLAFAVAAHLDTEILLVDEVLAVGDVNFQKKCLGKMDEVARHGRTVIFISHAMSAIQRLCGRAIVLADGGMTFEGGVAQAIQRYLELRGVSEYTGPARRDKPAITRASAQWGVDAGLVLDVEISSPFAVSDPLLGLVLYDSSGSPIFGTNGLHDPHERPASMASGAIRVAIDTSMLRPDTYAISLWYSSGAIEAYVSLEHALSVEVGTLQAESHLNRVIGSVRLPAVWQYRS